jgi:hypothetical protein
MQRINAQLDTSRGDPIVSDGQMQWVAPDFLRPIER